MKYQLIVTIAFWNPSFVQIGAANVAGLNNGG